MDLKFSEMSLVELLTEEAGFENRYGRATAAFLADLEAGRVSYIDEFDAFEWRTIHRLIEQLRTEQPTRTLFTYDEFTSESGGAAGAAPSPPSWSHLAA